MSRLQTRPLGLTPVARPDRRNSRRIVPGRLTPCRIEADGLPPTDAMLHNVSLAGAAVLASHPFLPGTSVRLLLVNAAHTFALQRLWTVVRCTRIFQGDYFLAGHFPEPLGYEDVLPFLL